MPKFNINDHQRIHYETNGSGPAVFFLHSALLDSRQWVAQAILQDHYQCTRYDLMSYGQSTDLAEPFDPADHLFALMDHLHVERAALVGSSAGGSIALHAAIQRPERVSSLFLAGTGLFGFEPTIERDDPPLYREYEAAFVNQDIERAVECAKTIWLWGINGSADDIEEPAVRAFTAMYRDLLTTHPWSGPTYLDLNDVPDVSHITTPMMVLIGENDTAYCQLLVDFLQQNLPHVVIQRMPHVAHFPNLSQPSLFNQFLTDWLSDSTKPR